MHNYSCILQLHHECDLTLLPTHKISCIITACDDAGKYPECHCINRNNTKACFAPKGNCYCDPLCKFYGDCCADAQSDNISLCSPSELYNHTVSYRLTSTCHK